jgi:hypothetical protein
VKNSLTGGAVATTTGAMGLARITEMIPNDIGKVACLVGILGTFSFIIAQWVKIYLDLKISKKINLEIKNGENGKK